VFAIIGHEARTGSQRRVARDRIRFLSRASGTDTALMVAREALAPYVWSSFSFMATPPNYSKDIERFRDLNSFKKGPR